VPLPGGPDLDERVLRTLRQRGPLTGAEIGVAVGLDRMAVRHALLRLKGQGLVRVAGMAARRTGAAEAMGGRPGIWEAVPQP
jgi:predicted ArsR family transcriptional regulator